MELGEERLEIFDYICRGGRVRGGGVGFWRERLTRASTTGSMQGRGTRPGRGGRVGDLGDVPCLMFFRWPRKWIIGLWTCEARIMRVGIMLAGGLGWYAAKVRRRETI